MDRKRNRCVRLLTRKIPDLHDYRTGFEDFRRFGEREDLTVKAWISLRIALASARVSVMKCARSISAVLSTAFLRVVFFFAIRVSE
jgi:hypothetical protein